MQAGFFNRLIVPGLIFQSTLVGGGYATGRELIEFFLLLGPRAGLAALLVSVVVISVSCAIAFELARQYALYDYRTFFRKLLGRAWPLFEIAFLALVLLVLSVLGAASNELLQARFDVPAMSGSILLMATVGALVFSGSTTIRAFLTSWSVLLYLSYVLLIGWSLLAFGADIQRNLTVAPQPAIGSDALRGGVIYAGYNIIAFTSVLFVIRQLPRRRDALWAGALCGPLGMIPGLLLMLAMAGHYPQINDEALPINYLLALLQAPGLLLLFQLVIFGTFIETGAAFLHAINERVNHVFEVHSAPMPRLLRPAISVGFMMVAIFLADRIGIVGLIGQGYTYATYLFLGIVVMPLLTRGVVLIRNHHSQSAAVP